ncbi:MAG: molybdopterin molybdotransferase MoeA [Paracoccaceae bacterium]
MLPVEEALRRCLALAPPLPAETVALRHATGRVLAAPVAARRDQPPFDASAMDGYAVAGDPAAGSVLDLIGEAGAGHAFAGRVGPGQAVRIFTGAPVPAGATRVIIQENTRAEGARVTVTAQDGATNIRQRGQDFRTGDTVAPRRLRPADLALLAAMNIAEVPVARRPTVAILATGDELVMPGEDPRPDQIVASNGFALAAMVEAEGAEARLLPIARDTVPALESAFALAEGADLILTIGGASVGDHDLVGPVAQRLGMEAAFWKIALRPGKPLLAGRLRGAALVGLPGNPVSSIVCTMLFVLPMIRAMQGVPDPASRPLRASLGCGIEANGPRAHFMRARLARLDGAGDLPRITPFEGQDSALLRRLTEADALLIRPMGDPARKAGEIVEYLPI